MQILSISLKNIKSHRDRQLNFVPGINVLSGANGVGKSTIFEAIGYCLFGVDARDFVGNIERFITIGAKKGEITVAFATDNGEIYRVSRTVGAGSKWLLARKINGAFEVEDHAGATETEARITELLGLDAGRPLADQFKLVIGPFQNDFLGPFVLKQPTKRQEAFDEILGIDAWRKTYKGTSSLLSVIRNKIDVLAAEIAGRVEQVAVLPERKKELTALEKEIETRRQTLADKEKALGAAEKELLVLDGQEKAATSVKSAIQVLESRIRDGEAKVGEQQKLVNEAKRAIEIIEQNRPGKVGFEAAESNLKKLRDQEQLKKALEKELTTLEKESLSLAKGLEHEKREIDKTIRQLDQEETQLKQNQQKLVADQMLIASAARLPKLKSEAEELRTTIGLLAGRRAGLLEGKEKLGEGVCPFFKEECRNIVGTAPRDVFTAKMDSLDQESLVLAKRLAGLDNEIQTAEKAGQQLEAQAVRAQELEKQFGGLTKRREENKTRALSLEGAGQKLAEAEARVTNRRQDFKKFSDLDKEIAGLEKLRTEHQTARDLFVANEKAAMELQNRSESLAKMTEFLKKLKQELADKQQELSDLTKTYDAKRHADTRLQKEKMVAEVATIRQQMTDLAKDQARLTDAITKLSLIEKEIKARSIDQKAFEAKEELVNFLRTRIFNNVSVQLSERLREEISFRADRIYRTIAETDEELYWGDKYRIVLRDMQDGILRERSDDQLSGGQTMSSVVALRLAMLQTIKARVAFFDEPTSNLDAARRENLAQAFRAIDIGREEVTEHWYDQLFLISHDIAFTEVTDQIISLE